MLDQSLLSRHLNSFDGLMSGNELYNAEINRIISNLYVGLVVGTVTLKTHRQGVGTV